MPIDLKLLQVIERFIDPAFELVQLLRLWPTRFLVGLASTLSRIVCVVVLVGVVIAAISRKRRFQSFFVHRSSFHVQHALVVRIVIVLILVALRSPSVVVRIAISGSRVHVDRLERRVLLLLAQFSHVSSYGRCVPYANVGGLSLCLPHQRFPLLHDLLGQGG